MAFSVCRGKATCLTSDKTQKCHSIDVIVHKGSLQTDQGNFNFTCIQKVNAMDCLCSLLCTLSVCTDWLLICAKKKLSMDAKVQLWLNWNETFESCQRYRTAIYFDVANLPHVLILIIILLQAHIRFQLKTAMIHILLVPCESLHSLPSNPGSYNRPGLVLTLDCSF